MFPPSLRHCTPLRVLALRAAEKLVNAVILSSSEGSRSERFQDNERFFLRFAQDRLLAPQNDSVNEFFRRMFSPCV
jgi:hypothetical protein